VGVDCGGGGEDRGGFAWALIAAAVGERGLNRGRQNHQYCGRLQ
jgi:hypothetical protein